MLIAFTGAGISAPSGIPTFSEQPGIRDRLTRGFATRHPDEYKSATDGIRAMCDAAEPNDAHLAISEHGVPVVTMNVDGLHSRAGSEHVLEIHGSLRRGDVVLYGDPAPLYSEAMDWMYRLGQGDALLVVGTSFYTAISCQLVDIARRGGAEIVRIDDSAETKVREAIQALADRIEPFEDFMAREEDGPAIPPPYAGGWEMP